MCCWRICTQWGLLIRPTWQTSQCISNVELGSAISWIITQVQTRVPARGLNTQWNLSKALILSMVKPYIGGCNSTGNSQPKAQWLRYCTSSGGAGGSFRVMRGWPPHWNEREVCHYKALKALFISSQPPAIM